MDPDWWAGSINRSCRAHPGVAERLIVEITETVAIQDIDDLRGFVTRLKNFGSRIAIDDFGAGYTSFRNLRKLGVDIVKIDGAFVQNIARSADDRAFVQTLIDLARRLEIKTVAEWVQDDKSAVMLRDWGCDYVAGHLIGLASSQRPWSMRPGAALPAAGSDFPEPAPRAERPRYHSSFLGSSTSARGDPASPSSGGAGPRCCRLPAAGSGVPPARRRRCRRAACTNGLNIEKVRSNSSMLRRTCSSSGAKDRR